MSVIGVDPGLTGAMARYDSEADTLDIMDMPTWWMTVGKKKRQRVDAVDLAEYFELAKMMGVELVVIEAVGGRPKQSAGAGFVFGYTVGLIYMACVMCRLVVETVPPQTWKKFMRVPGKKGLPSEKRAAEQAIQHRADELFPHHRDKWRGPHGGKRLDRCEAAMLAKFGTDYVLKSVHTDKPWTMPDAELKLAYMNADTGA